MKSEWAIVAESLAMKCSLSGKLVRVLVYVGEVLHYVDECIEIKAINSSNEKLLFVRRHILHDLLPIGTNMLRIHSGK